MGQSVPTCPSFFPQKAKCQKSGEEALLSLQLPKQDAALGFLSPKEMECFHCTAISEGEYLFYGLSHSATGVHWGENGNKRIPHTVYGQVFLQQNVSWYGVFVIHSKHQLKVWTFLMRYAKDRMTKSYLKHVMTVLVSHTNPNTWLLIKKQWQGIWYGR